MHSLRPELVAALINASRTSLKELTIEPPKGLQEFLKAQREHWDAIDSVQMHMQNLRSLTLRMSDLPNSWSAVSQCLDDAIGILNITSTSTLVSLDLRFNPSALFQLSESLGNPLLKIFEQSITRFTARQTIVSLSKEPLRKNRQTFWTPMFARVFPLFYGQGKVRESSQ